MAEKIINTMKMIVLFWAGITLIALGLVLMPVPILPGLILVIIGTSILTRAFEKLPSWMDYLTIPRLKKEFAINKNRIIKTLKSWP